MPSIKSDFEPTVRDQIKKFALQSTRGFQTVITYGLGSRIGIFDYLFEKGKKSGEPRTITSLTFTLEELKQNLDINTRFLDAWLHMAVECGIFEIDESCEKCLKTAPHVFDILIDRHNMFYVGGTLNAFYLISPYQDSLAEQYKSGNVDDYSSIRPEDYKLAQSICVVASNRVEEIYSKFFKDHRRKLRKGGFILEVGCGYGYNMELWAKKYKRTHIVGIDIDPNGVAYVNKLIRENNWDDRIEAIQISINEYAKSNENKFDLIFMNHVLHEMDTDDEYRKSAFEGLYTMLKDDGIVIVVEHMISDMFAPRDRFLFFEVWHKFYEVGFNSKFYNEKTFKDFVASTPFANAELIQDRHDYFWALTK